MQFLFYLFLLKKNLNQKFNQLKQGLEIGSEFVDVRVAKLAIADALPTRWFISSNSDEIKSPATEN